MPNAWEVSWFRSPSTHLVAILFWLLGLPMSVTIPLKVFAFLG
jgi:hypothetical protein